MSFLIHLYFSCEICYNISKGENAMSSKLFKDRLHKSETPVQAQQLIDAIIKGSDDTKKLLFNTPNPDEYKGKYILGNHRKCNGFHDEKDPDCTDEQRICKCLYYKASNHSKVCSDCSYCNYPQVEGRYKILDYEVPSKYRAKGIKVKNIDLVISDTLDANKDILYATEAKPPREDSPESVLRMISEIITYTIEDSRYKKAIIFFENSPQDTEYKTLHPKVKELILLADITVFRIFKNNRGNFEICKL